MRSLFFILFLFATQVTHSQTDSSRYVISLLTCAPGDALYSTFGHSAIRVVDRQRGKDEVYNYGIFDFDTPNFYVKFVRGKLDYKLGKQSFRGFLREYQYFKRDVVENKFNLNEEQALEMIRLLEVNYRPENRYYAYDFFFDNCSSRIRDVIEKTKGGELGGVDKYTSGITFRQMLDDYLKDKPWSDFGIDLILGQPSDGLADFRNQMYLPDYLKDNMRSSLTPEGPALQEKKIVFAFPLMTINPPWYILPIFWASFLFVLALFLSLFKNRSLGARIFDSLLFTISGLAGSLFLFMWLGTDHQACWANWNMLWLFPLNLFTGWQLFKKETSSYVKKYFSIISVLIVLAVLGWWIIPQQYHLAFLPLMGCMLLRLYFRNLTFVKKKKRNEGA